MKLREWMKLCGVGDTCTVHGARIQCQHVQPDKWISGCSDCAFIMCDCAGVECEALDNPGRGNVHFVALGELSCTPDLDMEVLQ